MKPLIDWLIGLVDEYRSSQQHVEMTEATNWKYCIALQKLGWKVSDVRPIAQGSDGVILKWEKEDKSVKITLSFADQCALTNYMYKEKGDDENKDKEVPDDHELK